VLDEADALAVVVSDSRSPWVEAEAQHALEVGIPVYPIRARGSTDIPGWLEGTSLFDAGDRDDLDRLAMEIRGLEVR
jgi:hypothetical protein